MFCADHALQVPRHIYDGMVRRYDPTKIKQSREFYELARHAVAALIGQDKNLESKRKAADGGKNDINPRV